MTTLSKDEIMAMVEEAGFEHKNHLKYRGRYNKCTVLEQFEIDCFERFATLCRADLVAENEQLRTELATANERHAGLMLAVVDRDKIIKQYAAAMKRGEA